MDPTVQIALIGVLSTVLTTAGVVIAAVTSNRKERGKAAESAVEAALRERITLKDEQLDDLRGDIAARDHKIAQLQEDLNLCREGRL